MMLFTSCYLVAAALLTSAVQADGQVCNSKSSSINNFRIQSQSDADALSNCGTLQGDVTITGGGQINMPSLSSVSGALNISGIGGGSIFRVGLPSLKTAGNVTVQFVDSLTLTALKNITVGDFVVRNNTFTSLVLPQLEHVDGSVAIIGNEKLNSLQMSDLESIGGSASRSGNMTIQDNPSLTTLTSINDLNIVRGNISLSGPFQTVRFPDLKSFAKGFSLNSTKAGFDCSAFDRINATSPSHNQYVCRASLPGSTKDTARHADGTHSTLSHGAIIAIVVLVIALIIAAVAAFCAFRWCMARRRRARAAGSVRAVPVVPGDFIPGQTSYFPGGGQKYGPVSNSGGLGGGRGVEEHEMHRPMYNHFPGPPPGHEQYR